MFERRRVGLSVPKEMLEDLFYVDRLFLLVRRQSNVC